MMFWYANSMNGWGYALMVFAMIAFWVLIVLAVIAVIDYSPGHHSHPILTPILLSSSSHSGWPAARSTTTNNTHLEWLPGSNRPCEVCIHSGYFALVSARVRHCGDGAISGP